jgi:sialate O-acetylesterase
MGMNSGIFDVRQSCPLRLDVIEFTEMSRFSIMLLAALPLTAHANVTVAALFTDHAVLQRDASVPVWGSAAPGETVTVKFRDQTVSATTAPDGRWSVHLSPLKPGAPTSLIVSGKNTITLKDIVVGEVWVCSGQSNMEFRVWGPPGDVYRVNDADAEVAAANHPMIRHFKVEQAVATHPSDTARGSWIVCSPATVGQFTAVGYFFARDMSKRLGVPIGIINSTWGGTAIESWLNDTALRSDPAFAVVGQRWAEAMVGWQDKVAAYKIAVAKQEKDEAAARAAGTEKLAQYLKDRPWLPPPPSPESPDAPQGLFNGMINPLIPYAIRGVLWYQGESNGSRPGEYHALFAAMIKSWRGAWGEGDFPFLFVQLPNWKTGDPSGLEWAQLREAQAQALSLPNTGMAVTIDTGEPGNIHPRDKQDVGRRLALIAGHKVYGLAGVWSGPRFVSAERSGAAMRVRMDSEGGNLVMHGKELTGFAVAGADRHFVPASARIDGSTIIVSTPGVPEPVAVRYAWTDAPVASLFNDAGLPAAPFRSDRW